MPLLARGVKSHLHDYKVFAARYKVVMWKILYWRKNLFETKNVHSLCAPATSGFRKKEGSVQIGCLAPDERIGQDYFKAKVMVCWTKIFEPNGWYICPCAFYLKLDMNVGCIKLGWQSVITIAWGVVECNRNRFCQGTLDELGNGQSLCWRCTYYTLEWCDHFQLWCALPEPLCKKGS